MTTYVLGAGASRDAGYPLSSTMASELLQWMKRPIHDRGSYAGRYPATARFLQETFGPVENVEDLVTQIHELIDRYEYGTEEQRSARRVVANQYGVLKNAVRGWFSEIQQSPQAKSSPYKDFAENVIVPGDCVITFNYDVSLERELRFAGKFEVGDGYGFSIESVPNDSATKVFKLHGSTNWLALLFGGITSGGLSFEPGHTLGPRPAIPKNELEFLGYKNAVDSAFGNGGAALPVMIFPARSKEFYFEASTGREYADFWNSLWQMATAALRSSSRIIICGYSLLPVDQRACEHLLTAPGKDAEIIIASGRGDSDRIVNAYREAGYDRAQAADELYFREWVASLSPATAGTR